MSNLSGWKNFDLRLILAATIWCTLSLTLPILITSHSKKMVLAFVLRMFCCCLLLPLHGTGSCGWLSNTWAYIYLSVGLFIHLFSVLTRIVGVGPAKRDEVGYGPLRVWPGGSCLSRGIGDFDIGAPVIACPYISQVHNLLQNISYHWWHMLCVCVTYVR